MVDHPRTPLVLRHWSKVQLQNQPLGYAYSNFVIGTVDSNNLPCNATGWFNPWGPRQLTNVGFVKAPQPVAGVVATPPPIGQYDWPVPRGPQRAVDLNWTQRSRQLFADATNLPAFTSWFNPWGRLPLNVGFVQAPPPVAAVTALPPGQQSMVLPPREPPRCVTLLTHTDSFKLPLQQVLPTGQGEQTLPPKSQRRNLPDWQDYILPWAQAPPQANYDWPVPKAPARLIALGHSDSFKLPLQQVLPPNQTDWPVPRGPQRVHVGFVVMPPPAAPAVSAIIRQADWPNPPAPQRAVNLGTWTQSPRPPEPDTTNLPCTAVAWFNPWGRAPLNVGSVQASGQWLLSPVATVAIMRQADWPNPRGPRQPSSLNTWTQSPRPPEPDTTNLPCTVGGWFNPWGRRRSVDLLTWTNPITQPTAVTTVYVSRGPQFFRNWAPRRTQPLGWTQLPRLPEPTPSIAQRDWPNPRGPRPLVRDWSDSFKLPLQQTLPPRQTDWPVPRAARRNPQDWIEQTPNTLTVAPAAPPIAQYDWPIPKRAARNPQDWSDSFKLPLQQVLPPHQTDWPNPRGRRPLVLDWTLAGNALLPTASADAPCVFEWFNPWGPRRNPQDWIQPTNLALTTVAASQPFTQTDWPVLQRARRTNPDWSDSFKLPLQEVLPPRQTDWPVSQGARRNPQDWQSYTLPLAQAPQRQLDWPNPALRKPPVVVDWSQAPSVTLTFVQPPFRQADWPVPKVKLGVLQTWTDSFKLPLQQVLPPTQKNWPLPTPAARRNPQDYWQPTNIALYFTVQVMPPNALRDWPNPRGPQQPVITARDFVVGVVPPIPPSYDDANTLKNEIRRLRDLSNKTGRIRFLKNEIRR